MNRAYEQLSLDFSSRAQKLFTFTYDSFCISIQMLDRQRDENVFQRQAGKFLTALKLQLENIAYELLYRDKSLKNIDHGNRVLRDKINIYLMEFVEKVRLI